jgi:hypothetical protein
MILWQTFADNHALYGDPAIDGAEHRVYRDPRTARWYKANAAMMHATWLEYFHRLFLHEIFQPSTAYTFEGFSVDENNELVAIVSQPDVHAIRGATITEVKADLDREGWEHTLSTNFMNEGGILMEDLHDENALVVQEATATDPIKIAYIDPIFYLDMDRKIERVGDYASSSDQGRTSYAIAPAEYTARITAAIQARMADPDIRRAVLEQSMTRFQRVRERNTEALSRLRAGNVRPEDIRGEEINRSIGELSAIASAFPPEVRGRIIQGIPALAQVKGPQGRLTVMQTLIARLDNAMEDHLREVYDEQLTDLLEAGEIRIGEHRVPRGRVSPEGHRIVADVQRIVKLSQDAINQEFAAVEAGLLTAYTDEQAGDLYERFNHLQLFAGWDDRSAAERQAGVAYLEDVIQNGRSQQRIMDEARREQFRQQREAWREGIGGNPASFRSKVQADERESRRIGGALGYAMSLFDFRQFVRRLTRPGQEQLADTLADQVRRANNQVVDRYNAGRRRMMAELARILGTRGDFATMRRVWDLSQQRESGIEFVVGRRLRQERIAVDQVDAILDGTSPLAESLGRADRQNLAAAWEEYGRLSPRAQARRRFIEFDRQVDPGQTENQLMSQLDAVAWTMLYAQPGYRATMLQHMGYDEAVAAQVEAWLTPEARAIREWLLTQYRESYAPMNQVFREMFGVNMPQNENYSPARFDTGREAADMLFPGMNDQTGTGGMSAGFIKSRIQHRSRPKQVNALAIYAQHAYQTEYWQAFAPLMREVRATVGHRDTLASVEATTGKGNVRRLRAWLDVLDGQGNRTGAGMEALNDLFNGLSRAQAFTGLAWNVGVWFKQASAVLGSVLEMPGNAW